MRGRKPQPKSPPPAGKTRGFPTAPATLTKGARAEWDRLAGELGSQCITALDLQVLRTYCENVELYGRAKAKLAKAGEVVETEKGYPIQNPWLAIANRAEERIVKAATEMGLTPVSRTRLAKSGDASPTADEPTGIESFLRIAK